MSEDTTMGRWDILKAVAALDPAEQRRLLAELKQIVFPDKSSLSQATEEIREKRFSKGFSCPYCSNDKVVRYGIYKTRQRYLCRSCKRTFNDLSLTPLRGTHHPDKWIAFLDCMINGLSLRRCAKKLDIAVSTCFYWRHKVLNAIRRMEIEAFEGILELDETFFLHSEKGRRGITWRKPRKRGGVASKRGISDEQICVVVARDRTKRTHAEVACAGQVSKAQAKEILDSHVKGVSSLCSDASTTWRAYANEKEFSHMELNLSKGVRVIKRIYHVQNVNAYHRRLKKWLEHFNGVATKFLNNYLAWFRFLDAHKTEAMSGKRLKLLIDSCLPVSNDTYAGIRMTQFILK